MVKKKNINFTDSDEPRDPCGHDIINFTLMLLLKVFKWPGTDSNPHTPPRSHILGRSDIFTLGSSSVKTVIKSLI